MKRITLGILCLVVLKMASAQEYYYYYKGEKISLVKDEEKVYVQFEQNLRKSSLQQQLKLQDYFEFFEQSQETSFKVLEWKVGRRQDEKQKAMSILRKEPGIVYADYFLKSASGSISVNNQVVVKLKESTTQEMFEDALKRMPVLGAKQNTHDLRKYVLELKGRTAEETFLQANSLVESGLVEFAEPNFLFGIRQSCVNDTYFNDQWALPTIKACEAWQITKGDADIRIAVIDDGIDDTHPDLSGQVAAGKNFTNYGPESDYLPVNNAAHGTVCAGIIGAKVNNGIGVAGVAPDCKMLSVKTFYEDSQGYLVSTSDWQANGILWAGDANGGAADVINISWESHVPSSAIDNAVLQVMQTGRNGLGTVVVVASGNGDDGKPVEDPAHINNIHTPANIDGVITVGGVSSGEKDWKGQKHGDFDHRRSTSKYGNELDIVAPGELLASTNISGPNGYPNNQTAYNDDYLKEVAGTSFAAPQVAATIGLMLSVNRCLSREDVERNLMFSVDKPGEYCYSRFSDKHFGTWHNEMGYGRLNVLKAVENSYSWFTHSQHNIGYQHASSNSSLFSWILLPHNCISTASGTYFVYRHEVIRDVSFPYLDNPELYVLSNGFSGASPNSGDYWADAINVTNSSARLRTFVYQIISSGTGATVGFTPCHPTEVNFTYFVKDAVGEDLFLQNQTINDDKTYRALHTITAGSHVTTAVPYGPFIINSTDEDGVLMVAGQKIRLENGFEVKPGAKFQARIGSAFSCSEYPYGEAFVPREEVIHQLYSMEFEEEVEEELFETDVDENMKRPLSLALSPNPGREKVMLRYNLDADTENHSLQIFDLQGMLVENIEVSGMQKRGQYESTLNVENYAPGVYMVKLVAGDQVVYERLIRE